MLEFVTIGVVLGISAGFAPGPLLALVIAETLRHGVGAGVLVALSPILTDLPIVVLTLVVLSQLSGFQSVLGGISLLGGIVVLFMGWGSMNPKPAGVGEADPVPRSLLKGVLANALSPHPYLFWFSVGAPIMTRAKDTGWTAGAVFICGFYVCLIGSKVLLATLVGRSRAFLTGRAYRLIMRVLGAALCILALLLFRDGLQLLGVLPS